MENPCVLVLTLLCLALLSRGGTVTASKSQDGSEDWGYVEVRPKAHMFWWLYRSPYRVEHPSKPWPIILWLQGGPGASSSGFGNFQEIGPLDQNLKPREYTWLQAADLLFLDNPVGTGYSYVEDPKASAKSDEEAASDMTNLLIKIFNNDKSLKKSPVYIIGESYGGRFAVTLGLSALKAVQAGKLHLKLGGVVMADSWISPEDFVFSWGPLLKDVSRLDGHGLRKSNSMARKIKKQLQDGHFVNATQSWSELEAEISFRSNDVSWYNFLRDNEQDNYGGGPELVALMNGAMKKKLKIIPHNVRWQVSSDSVFNSFQGVFMKPKIHEVDELLAKGINVTVYNGQVDVICATKGVEAWVRKLKWEGLPTFLGKERYPLYCEDDKWTKGFVKSYKNLRFFWILNAGHMVPRDQPCAALWMVAAITNSPAVSS